MSRWIQILLGLVMIVGAGLVHGAWTNRWRPSHELTRLAARLAAVPMKVGDWSATATELPADELEMTGAVGYLCRMYRNGQTGVSVSVLLLCGLPGPISSHAPDVCYPGAGYSMGSLERQARDYGSPARNGEFLTALASRGGVTPSRLRIFWSWNPSNGWSVPENPRWTFANSAALCKLYLVREAGTKNVGPEEDPCNEFVAAFLPEVDRALFPADGQPG